MRSETIHPMSVTQQAVTKTHSIRKMSPGGKPAGWSNNTAAEITHWVDDVKIRLVIDLDMIARQLGVKAVKSRNGKATMASRAIVATVIDRKPRDRRVVEQKPFPGYEVVDAPLDHKGYTAAERAAMEQAA